MPGRLPDPPPIRRAAVVGALAVLVLTLASCDGAGGSCWGYDCGRKIDDISAEEAEAICDERYRDIDPAHYGRFRCDEEGVGPVGRRDQCAEVLLDEIGWCETTLGQFYDCFEPWYTLSCEELIEIGGTPAACRSIRDRTTPCDE